MKNFTTFIIEEKEPYYSVKETPVKGLLKQHLKARKLHTELSTMSEYSRPTIMGTYIPDREIKNLTLTIGNKKITGIGETFNSLDEFNEHTKNFPGPSSSTSDKS